MLTAARTVDDAHDIEVSLARTSPAGSPRDSTSTSVARGGGRGDRRAPGLGGDRRARTAWPGSRSSGPTQTGSASPARPTDETSVWPLARDGVGVADELAGAELAFTRPDAPSSRCASATPSPTRRSRSPRRSRPATVRSPAWSSPTTGSWSEPSTGAPPRTCARSLADDSRLEDMAVEVVGHHQRPARQRRRRSPAPRSVSSPCSPPSRTSPPSCSPRSWAPPSRCRSTTCARLRPWSSAYADVRAPPSSTPPSSWSTTPTGGGDHPRRRRRGARPGGGRCSTHPA